MCAIKGRWSAFTEVCALLSAMLVHSVHEGKFHGSSFNICAGIYVKTTRLNLVATIEEKPEYSLES